jgi:hypothetical protein
MRVYRVECPDGRGPYNQGDNAWSFRLGCVHTGSSHPSPFVDSEVGNELELGLPSKNWVCGFKSMKDLYAWFGGYLKGAMRELDARIVMYEAKAGDVRIGQHQVVFNKYRATLVNRKGN